MRNPASWKVETVNSMSSSISSSKVSAIVSIKGISNNQLQKIRRDLRGKITLKVSRGTLIEKALEKSGVKGYQSLKPLLSGQIGLLTTDIPPTQAYETLLGTKQKSPAKGGEIAEEDIIVEAKETAFPPGPMVSEFQKVGLQAAIEKGKIVIKKETVLVKKGEQISKEKASVLKKLEILPLTVGLDMKGALYEGLFFSEEALSLTPSRIIQDLTFALVAAKRIAVSSRIVTPETLPELLFEGRKNAEFLAVAAGILDESNIELFILKAIRDASALQSVVGGEPASSTGESASDRSEKPKEKKEDVDEQISEGLGALFD